MTAGRLKVWNALAEAWEYVAPGGGSQPMKGPITVTLADVPNDQDTFEIYTPVDGALIYDILFSVNPQWDASAVADLFDGDPNTGMNLGAEGNTDFNSFESEIDGFGARGFTSLTALTGGSDADHMPYVSTGEPITLRITYQAIDPTEVTAVNQGTKTFTFTDGVGNWTVISPGNPIVISGSTGNDGTYTAVSAAADNGTSHVVVAEAIPNATADGTLTIPLIPTEGETQFIIDDRGVPAAP